MHENGQIPLQRIVTQRFSPKAMSGRNESLLRRRVSVRNALLVSLSLLSAVSALLLVVMIMFVPSFAAESVWKWAAILLLVVAILASWKVR